MQSPSNTHTAGLPKRLWQAWKRFGTRLADIQARVLLTLFYFVVVPPFGLAVRWFGDPLAIKRGHARGWTVRPPEALSAAVRARRQF